MKYSLTLTAFIFLLLTGCLEDETPCTYNRLFISNLTADDWNVDTLHMFIYDSVSLYKLDTIFINDGTLRFQADKLDCSEKYATPRGTLRFNRSDGNSYLMKYSFTSQYPFYGKDVIYMGSTDSLDGFAEPYSAALLNTWENDKMTFTYNNRYEFMYDLNIRNKKYVRYWEFVLSKK